MKTKKKLIVIFGVVATLLSIPFIAMQFSNAINWSILDFVIMGILLFSVLLVIDMVWRRFNSKYRILGVIVVIVLFLLLWAELAVGIFDSPIAGS
ncbi:MAG: hypothetical protein H6553_04005 [Chitinophagales bacterium]|nr:hypothetical protein [Chitinophagales bacterium]